MTISNYKEDRDTSEYYCIATAIMFQLMEIGDTFNADDFYSKAREESMPPDLIKKYSGSRFREFQAAGYIEKTGEYKLSNRNGSSPLPLWIARNHKQFSKVEEQYEQLKS